VWNGGLLSKRFGTCAYRKSNPDIFVMQSTETEDRAAKNAPCPLYGAR
jgi:hypothetical protein